MYMVFYTNKLFIINFHQTEHFNIKVGRIGQVGGRIWAGNQYLVFYTDSVSCTTLGTRDSPLVAVNRPGSPGTPCILVSLPLGGLWLPCLQEQIHLCLYCSLSFTTK